MKGLKKYTHRDRQKIVEKLIPQIRQKFGDNLIALAAQGSFARSDIPIIPISNLSLLSKKCPQAETASERSLTGF